MRIGLIGLPGLRRHRRQVSPRRVEEALMRLGTPEVDHSGRAITFPTRKALALLAYLAVEGGHHTREAIAALFWPESDAEQARGSLRYTLTALRGALDEADGIAHCVADRGVLGFNVGASFELDTHVVQAAFAMSAREPPGAMAALARAADVCRGEFLEGFSLRDAPGFDEWVGLQRAVWQRRMSAVLDRLSQAQWEQAALEAAVETATRWLRLDPLDESAHRRLMQLHLTAGDPTSVLRAYEACRAILGKELGAEPSPETESLVQRARAGVPAGRGSRPGLPHRLADASFETPLVGRADGLMKGVELYHAARQGRPQVVSIEGEAGIGKTRLADELLAWAAGQGADVLRGRAFEMGGRLPYQPLLDALRPRLEHENAPEDLLSDVWLAELSRVLPELRERYPDLPMPTGDEVVARTRLFEALARLGQALAERSPAVLFVDDVQWADAASLDVLHYVARRWAEAGTRVLLVLSLRAEARDSTPALREWLLGLRRDVTVTRLELGPLSQDDTFALVRGLIQDGPERAEPTSREIEEFARWLFAETGGQPFFVTETLRALLERGALARVPLERGTWGIALRSDALRAVAGSAYVSPEVREVIRVRLARLSPSAQMLLAAAAVLGQGFDFARLCRVADLAEKEALPALDETLRAHVLREIRTEGPAPGGAYGFSHDKLRDVTYEEAGDARRRVFHRHALETLETVGAPAAELAHHALAAGLQEQALGHSLAAGDEAIRVLAARDAIAHYSTAIALAERLGRPDQVMDLRARRAQAYASVGMWAEARRELEATLEALGADEEERRAELLVQVSAAYFWLLDIPSLRRSAGQAIVRAARVGRGDLEMSARGWMAGADGADGRLEGSIEQYDRAVARARELGMAPPAHVLTLHALVLYWLGRLDEATERSRAGLESARRANDASIMMYSLPHLGMALAARGRYDEAQPVFDEARRFGREYAIHTLLARAIAMSAGYRLDLFDFAGAEALACEARELAFSSNFPPPAASAGIDLLLNYARRGEVGRAEALLDEVAAAVELAAGFHGWLWRLRLAQARAEIALARNAWEDALLWAGRAIGQSSTTDRPKYRAAGLGARAQALAALGRHAEAVGDLRTAAGLARRLDDPALFLRLAGQLLDLDGDDALAAEARATVGRITQGLPNVDLRRCFESGHPVARVVRLSS
jgi:DNA-binding SARP family transcriptional activator